MLILALTRTRLATAPRTRSWSNGPVVFTRDLTSTREEILSVNGLRCYSTTEHVDDERLDPYQIINAVQSLDEHPALPRSIFLCEDLVLLHPSYLWRVNCRPETCNNEITADTCPKTFKIASIVKSWSFRTAKIQFSLRFNNQAINLSFNWGNLRFPQKQSAFSI